MVTNKMRETVMMTPNLNVAALGQDRPEPVGDGRHHVGENQDRHPLPDAAG